MVGFVLSIMVLCLMLWVAYERRRAELNQYYFDDLANRIVGMVNRHKQELDRYDSHIDRHKLKKFIESHKIHDEYVGSMIITYELEQAIGTGMLDIRRKENN